MIINYLILNLIILILVFFVIKLIKLKKALMKEKFEKKDEIFLPNIYTEIYFAFIFIIIIKLVIFARFANYVLEVLNKNIWQYFFFYEFIFSGILIFFILFFMKKLKDKYKTHQYKY